MARDLPRGIYKRGRIYWICYSTGAGRMKHESTGSTRLANAKTLLATRQDRRFREEKYPELTRSERLLGEVVAHYERHIQTRDTVDQIKPRLADAVAFMGEEKPTREISFETVDAWASHLVSKRKLQPQSLRLYLGALSAAFRYSKRSRLTDYNPMTDYEIPKGKRKRKRIASPDELAAILAFLDHHMKPVYHTDLRIAVVLAVETGMRRAEIAGLKRAWIDLRNRVVRLPPSATKTEEGRSVPLNKAALEILDVRPRDPIVRINPKRISEFFARVVKKLKIQDLHFHDLRHTRATTWIKAGVPEAVVQEILGHESVEMTRHYTNLTELDLSEAIAKLDLH